MATLATLLSFTGSNGGFPDDKLVLDAGGDIWGITRDGQRPGSPYLNAYIFEIAAGSHAASSFRAGVSAVSGGLAIDASDNLYGTTFNAIFEIAAGTHTATTLASLGAAPDAYIYGNGLALDAAGNVYGTNRQGGSGLQGTIIELAAGSHSLITLATFSGTDGSHPESGLIRDAAGNLYGTATNGGPDGFGSLFELAAGSHTLTTLATFGLHGFSPLAAPVMDPAGNIFGIAEYGGSHDYGTVWEYVASSHDLVTLADFTGSNGANPTGPLIRDAAGNLYGTASKGGSANDGTVFKIAAGSHTLTTLISFTGDNGANPMAGLTADAAGTLFGVTERGGASNLGTVFEVTGSGFVVSVVPLPTPRADHVIRVVTDNANICDASFTHIAGATNLTNNGHGDLIYALGATAQAAFAGQHLVLHSGSHALSFSVDAAALTASAHLDLYAEAGVAHVIGGAENDSFHFVASTWQAVGRTADGGGGTNSIALAFSGTVHDAEFVGIQHISEFDLTGTSTASIFLGANAAAAFGTALVKVVARNSSVLALDGSGLIKGFRGTGGSGNDTITGGGGNDTLAGGGGGDLFILGQGGKDVISDFVHGTDHIEIPSASIHDWAALHAHIGHAGSNALISLGADSSIKLAGVDYHQLTASDFIFG